MASEHTQTSSTVRVAAVQAEGCYFDLPAAVEKTRHFIEEAASKGCELIAFPELWIPMYPGVDSREKRQVRPEVGETVIEG